MSVWHIHFLIDALEASLSVTITMRVFCLCVSAFSPQNKYESNWVWHRKLAVHYCLKSEFKLALFVLVIVVVVVVFILFCFILFIPIHQSANAAKVEKPLIFSWTISYCVQSQCKCERFNNNNKNGSMHTKEGSP